GKVSLITRVIHLEVKFLMSDGEAVQAQPELEEGHQELSDDSSIDITRRRFLQGLGALVAIGGAGYLGFKVGNSDREFGDELYQPDGESFNEAGEQLSIFPDGDREVSETYLAKAEYTLEDLIQYAKETVFSTADAAEKDRLIESIDGDMSPAEVNVQAAEAVRKMTGQQLHINLDPNTGEPLRDTRPDLFPEEYVYYMQQLVAIQSVLPKGLVSLPEGGYNIILDYLPGITPEGIETVNTDISGTVHTRTGLLSLDITSTPRLEIHLHELLHVWQVNNRDYLDRSAYSELRELSRREYGSVTDMVQQITDLQGLLDRRTFDYAWTLAKIEDKEPDPRLEDEAYTLEQIANRGLLPKTGIPIVEHLRDKQLQALEDISVASGSNFGAALAFIERFNYTHPKTIATLADADILDSMSIHEGSGLGEKAPHEYAWNKQIGAQLNVINIGDSQNPEYLALHKYRTGDSYYGGNEYLLELYFPGRSSTGNLLELLNEPTTTTTSYLPETNPDGQEEFVVEEPLFSHRDGNLTDMIQTIFPGIKGSEIYISDWPEEDEHGNQIGGMYYTVRVHEDVIRTYLDPKKLVGWLDEDYQFEKFDQSS
ncbi:MAG: twin-arginine translocation signal domain-containing protein, partial [Candidatus Saccharimonadales bacterium]|nr:twin-arginine translocation signal domain-containing protein [Candidatus Saccharimonadales bacterium]